LAWERLLMVALLIGLRRSLRRHAPAITRGLVSGPRCPLGKSRVGWDAIRKPEHLHRA